MLPPLTEQDKPETWSESRCQHPVSRQLVILEVGDLNLGAYRRRTIVRCWRSGYVRCMSPLRRDSQTSCTHPEPACTRSSGRLLVILHAEGSIWRTYDARGEVDAASLANRGDPSGVPLNQDPAGQRRSGAHER